MPHECNIPLALVCFYVCPAPSALAPLREKLRPPFTIRASSDVLRVGAILLA
jgi:hypothetical protein